MKLQRETPVLTWLSEFDYELPPELIAQRPTEERDASRLLHLTAEGAVVHRSFRDLPRLLHSGDLLVLNDTRVFPARLEGRRSGGGRSEILLLDRLDSHRWRVLGRPGRKLRPGEWISFAEGKLDAEVLMAEEDGARIVRFRYDGDWDALLEDLGRTPLPPYIASGESPDDEKTTRRRYQTVYARSSGSIAAPTAGLHFTEATFEALRAKGVEVAFITLHVGHATFQPIRVEHVETHRMGIERFLVPDETREKIRRARNVVAVGTTTVRALESASLENFRTGWRETGLFITEGFEFRVVSRLLTNFHLPKSSLLLLVAAFGGRERVLAAYREAVRERYRFYSFGDAMLLDR
jgi:S-adenosylmethionine:tRNA ribosyltransferase-isomerase